MRSTSRIPCGTNESAAACQCGATAPRYKDIDHWNDCPVQALRDKLNEDQSEAMKRAMYQLTKRMRRQGKALEEGRKIRSPPKYPMTEAERRARAERFEKEAKAVRARKASQARPDRA